MLQRGSRLDLDDEAIGAEDGGEFRLEHLDRDLAVVLDVVREVDGRHAAAPEFALDPIPGRERRGELGVSARDRCHAGPRPSSARGRWELPSIVWGGSGWCATGGSPRLYLDVLTSEDRIMESHSRLRAALFAAALASFSPLVATASAQGGGAT